MIKKTLNNIQRGKCKYYNLMKETNDKNNNSLQKITVSGLRKLFSNDTVSWFRSSRSVNNDICAQKTLVSCSGSLGDYRIFRDPFI